MYPRISDLFDDLLGIDLPLDLYSFGLMVALAILVATYLTRIELDRLYARGLVGSVRAKVKDAKGRERLQETSPSVYVWTMMLLAAAFGVGGSKLFHIIDYWDEFVQNPAGMLFSGSGLTIYGGIICAGLAIAYYAYKKGIHVPRLADSVAPGLILAYGIGRIGCYLAGDGDWGVCSSLDDKPAWIPGFLWSETFPRNIVGPDYTTVDPIVYNATARGAECTLANPTGVYPTMLYEFAMASVLAGVLWLLRKHPFKGGWLFSLYAVFAGAERFLIEEIRVNPEAAFGLPQSQIISVLFIVGGLIGLAVTTRRIGTPPASEAPASAEAVAA
ncbi:MAG: prolipoprotein diacylglyceryl transferase family protein [Bacteroidota bacterium]